MTALIFLYVIATILLVGLYWLVRLVAYLIGKRKMSQQGTGNLNLDKDFKHFVKRTKIRKLLTVIWSTIGVLVLIFTGVMWLNSRQMSYLYQKTSNRANNYLEIQAPNISNNNAMINNYGTFSSNLHMDTYKNIDGYHVTWQDFDFGFGTFGAPQSGNQYYMSASPVTVNNGYYTQKNNQKIAAFFNRKANFKSKNYMGLQPTHEASKLPAAKNQLAEVAVTFQEPLTYAQIQKLVPKNLLINWYWLGINQPKLSGADYSTQYYGLGADDAGKLSATWYKAFVKGLNSSLAEENSGGYYNGFDPLRDARRQAKKYPTLATAKFAGVILTGRTQNFANLDKEKWVFATNTGLMTPIRPDVPPTK